MRPSQYRCFAMNIHKEHPPESEDLLALPEWTMETVQEGVQHIAIVKCSGVPKCRLSLVVPEADPEQAGRLLADKMRLWIRDYLNKREQGANATP